MGIKEQLDCNYGIARGTAAERNRIRKQVEKLRDEAKAASESAKARDYPNAAITHGCFYTAYLEVLKILDGESDGK